MNFFKKILNKLTNTEEEEEKQDPAMHLERDAFVKDLDYRFAQQFTRSGGFFNYCENEREALQILKQIYHVEQIQSTYCWDQDLEKFLNVINAPYTQSLSNENDAAFITCEFLIAFNGKIMLSHENIQHYHSSRLPEKTIVIATFSQIVETLHDALALVKRKGHTKNITSISGGESDLENINKRKTKLFLLILED